MKIIKNGHEFFFYIQFSKKMHYSSYSLTDSCIYSFNFRLGLTAIYLSTYNKYEFYKHLGYHECTQVTPIKASSSLFINSQVMNYELNWEELEFNIFWI